MRSTAFAALICLGLAACGSAPVDDNPYLKPNQLMEREIKDRISQIPFQQREELFNNLLWLAQTGEQAIPALLVALDDDNPKVRSNTLWVLGRIRDRRTITEMRPLVQDSDATVRLEAARTLVLLGDLQHTPVLIDGLDSDRVQVRYLCHEALRQATGREFGYDHLADDLVARNHAAYRWRKWWSDQSGDPWFAKDYASDRGLDVFEAENQWRIGSKPIGESVNDTEMGDGEEVEGTEITPPTEESSSIEEVPAMDGAETKPNDSGEGNAAGEAGDASPLGIESQPSTDGGHEIIEPETAGESAETKPKVEPAPTPRPRFPIPGPGAGANDESPKPNSSIIPNFPGSQPAAGAGSNGSAAGGTGGSGSNR